jgi:hypothetical protein
MLPKHYLHTLLHKFPKNYDCAGHSLYEYFLNIVQDRLKAAAAAAKIFAAKKKREADPFYYYSSVVPHTAATATAAANVYANQVAYTVPVQAPVVYQVLITYYGSNLRSRQDRLVRFRKQCIRVCIKMDGMAYLASAVSCEHKMFMKLATCSKRFFIIIDEEAK